MPSVTTPKKRESVASPMTKAVLGLEKWKLNIMFGVGLVGMGGIMYWFIFPEEGHEHMVSEMVVAGGIFLVCAFFAFPVGVTRFLDKFWPEKWSKNAP